MLYVIAYMLWETQGVQVAKDTLRCKYAYTWQFISHKKNIFGSLHAYCRHGAQKDNYIKVKKWKTTTGSLSAFPVIQPSKWQKKHFIRLFPLNQPHTFFQNLVDSQCYFTLKPSRFSPCKEKPSHSSYSIPVDGANSFWFAWIGGKCFACIFVFATIVSWYFP